ncbi:MAG: hypothetical protein ABI175_12235 [Polyangiales bacterium]
MALGYDELRATWTQVPEGERAATVKALIAASDAEVSRLDSFWPATYGDVPHVDVLGVVADHVGVRRVQFIASALNYNSAQSGSDWADHYVLVGTAVLESGNVLGAIELKTAASTTIREPDWPRYRASRVTEEVRDARLVELGVEPPPPEMVDVRMVRCPLCGSTDAGSIDHWIEVACMSCGVCGHTEWQDDQQIKDDWNVTLSQRKDERQLPPFAPPLASPEPGFELRDHVLVHPASGYAITLPDDARQSGARGAQVAFFEIARWVELVVRAHGFYTTDEIAPRMRLDLETNARRRAIKGATLDVLDAGPRGIYVLYPRRIPADDFEDTIEMLWLTVKPRDVPHYYDAVFFHARYPKRRLDAAAFEALRTSLFASQTYESNLT